jgi:hypothetical protein
MRKRGRLRTRERSKGEAITHGAGRLRSPWLLATLAVIVAAVLLVLASPEPGRSPDGDDTDTSGPGQVYQDVGIPLANVTTEADWYTYRSGATEVRFFTVLDVDGQPHIALDACDKCYSKRLGFHQNATKMQCNSCGKVFEVSGLGSQNLPNTCWPRFVSYRLSEGFMLIDTQVLDSRAYMFE